MTPMAWARAARSVVNSWLNSMSLAKDMIEIRMESGIAATKLAADLLTWAIAPSRLEGEARNCAWSGLPNSAGRIPSNRKTERILMEGVWHLFSMRGGDDS